MNTSPSVSLKPYNTFGIEAKALDMVEVSAPAQLEALVGSGTFKNTRALILGGGSNMLLTRDFEGTVVRMAIPGMEVVKDDGDSVLVRAGAGETWHRLVLWSLDQGLSGIENLSLIPGSVGAAPIQNIGAYGVELKDVFEELEAMDLASGARRTFKLTDCHFGYRDSFFKREGKGRFAILTVTLRLSREAKLAVSYGAIQEELAKTGKSSFTPRDVSDAVIRIRQSKLPDPAVIGNAGSFFKNPEIPEEQFQLLKASHPGLPSYPGSVAGRIKVPAGWLIEQAGWKGKRFGNYGVHAQQALVLVNYGGASGKDIHDLSTQIVEDIRSKFGIELEREVNVI